MEQTIVVAGQPRRNRITGQVILALLLFTFPLLALLVMEQGRVIDAQRLLIQQLSGDSQQLSSIRVRDLQNRAKQAAPAAKPPQAETQQPGAQPQSGAPPQAGAQPRSGAAPQSKNHKRRQTQEVAPPPPQEYPASRPMPVRKSA